ncbi:Uma2 family endonuclease [bacterium]|nr:Uma2 family endonuclease [bacterium]
MRTLLELSESEVLQNDRHAFNSAVWEKVLANPYYQEVEGRIETNALGEVIMSPPPAPEHGQKQSEIAFRLRSLLSEGRPITECPLSTTDGVRAIDVAWVSFERLKLRRNANAFTHAPEICVEVISPSNTHQEMAHKKELYFEAGAQEVWFCSDEGRMIFHLKEVPDQTSSSKLVPDMPLQIETF